jgi:phosphoadenosine phosphosulfate reductase
VAFGSEELPASGEVAALNLLLRDASPQTILRKAIDTYGRRLAMVSSFGAESAVLLHMAAGIDSSLTVLFLDTGHLFAQTLDYRKTLARTLGLTDVRDLRPEFQAIALADPKAVLWKTDTDACCAVRKVQPLDKALGGFDAWITGRKRFHGAGRLHLPIVEEAQGRVKFNPLAAWGKAELDAYAAEHALPPHPLVAFGYPSVGCWPCTKAVDLGADVRAGRWMGSQKTECGIHTLRTHTSTATEDDDVGGGI